MSSRNWFEPQSEDLIKQSLRHAKKIAREEYEDNCNVSVDYLEGRQREDTMRELTLRYPKMQARGKGQWIEPVTCPIVQRYTNDQATAYNRRVRRHLVDQDGQETEATKAQTLKLNRALGDDGVAFDEFMHGIERRMVNLGSPGIWWQAKRGNLRPVSAVPQWIYPISPVNDPDSDPADQEDYPAFAVSLAADIEDMQSANKRAFAHISPAATTMYEASDPYSPDKILGTPTLNPFVWDQTIDTDDKKGKLIPNLPLQMLTIFHRDRPSGRLFGENDVELALLNREINIQLSVILATIGMQGWGVLALHLTNPEMAPPFIACGPRFGLALAPEEKAEVLHFPNDYAGIVQVLDVIVKLEAISRRMSPQDYSIADNTRQAQSGFAKLVESLPKLEARDEHTARLARLERRLAWPRMCSILVYLGKLDESARKMSLVTQFDEISMPQTPQEEVPKNQFDLDNGLTTRAELMAKDTGMTIEEARDRVLANLQENAQTKPQQAPQEQPCLTATARGHQWSARS